MRSLPSPLSWLLLSALCFAALPALGQDRLEEELFSDEAVEEAVDEAEGAASLEADAVTPGALDEAPARRLDAPSAEAPALEADAAKPPVMRMVSAGVSSATGALAVSLAGAGVAFAHGGLWTLAGTDVGWLVGLGFVALPVIGAAGGAVLGASPFVDATGLAATAGAAAGGAGLGALLGFGIGSAIAGPQGNQKVPGENEHTAIVLTATVVGAGVLAAIGAGATAPFFTKTQTSMETSVE